MQKAEAILYELRAWSVDRDERGQRPLFVGVYPDYTCCLDVDIQTRLVRPAVSVVHAVSDLAGCLERWHAGPR